MNTFSDSLFVLEKLLREGFGDDNYRSCTMLVAIVKVAPFDNRDTHGLEITHTGRKEIGRRVILWRHGSAFDLKGDHEAVTTQRKRVNRARRLNSRRGFESILKIDEELRLLVILVFDFRQRDVECQNVLG